MVKLKKNNKEFMDVRGQETLLNWINVSTNHPLMNYIMIAFIDLYIEEKTCMKNLP